MLRRIIISIVCVVAVAGCKESVTESIKRTADTPGSYAQVVQFPIYNTTCEDARIYGPDPSCIGDGTVTKSCSTDPLTGKEFCTEDLFPSCYHDTQICETELVGHHDIKLSVEFDPAATLSGRQKEKYTFKGVRDGGLVTIKSSVKSRYYKYEFPEVTEINLYDDSVDEVSIKFKMIEKK